VFPAKEKLLAEVLPRKKLLQDIFEKADKVTARWRDKLEDLWRMGKEIPVRKAELRERRNRIQRAH
jgi:hypothetical protein